MERYIDTIESEVRQTFFRMSLLFGIGHAVVTTPLVLASAYLDEEVAYLGNAIFFATTVVVALVISVPVVNLIGVNNSIVYGLSMYVLYALGYTLSIYATSKAVDSQYMYYIFGCLCGGVGSGILWTSQGTYFLRTASYVSRRSAGRSSNRAEENAKLSSIFAFWYLITEILAKLGVPALSSFGVTQFWIAALYTTVGCFATVMMTLLPPLPPDHEAKESRLWRDVYGVEKTLDVVKLWRLPELWLLSLTNISFGFSSAYMNGYFNSRYAVPAVGQSSIAMLNAVNVAAASLLSRPLAQISQRAGNEMALAVGAVSFVGIALTVLRSNCCIDWGWYILVLYILQGMGRAVYESLNKAVFADFFPDPDAESAFANCYLQMAASQAACYFLSGSISSSLPVVILFTATPIPFFYHAARQLRLHQSKKMSAQVQQNGTYGSAIVEA